MPNQPAFARSGGSVKDEPNREGDEMKKRWNQSKLNEFLFSIRGTGEG